MSPRRPQEDSSIVLAACARELRFGIVLAAVIAAGAAPAFAETPDPSPAAVDEVVDRLAPIGARSPAFPPGIEAVPPDAADPALAIPPVFDAVPPGDGTLATGPSPRSYASAIVDPVRNRLIVFGGHSYDYLAEVWALPLAGPPIWSLLFPAGTAPPLRIGQATIYDPVRDRMLVFGGNRGTTNYNDVWALDLSGATAWSQIVPDGTPPIARLYPSAVYDPVRDRMIVFGGVSPNERHHDVWALSLSGTPAWTLLEPPGDQPPGQYLNTAIYDPARDRLVICGGVYADNDVWGVSLSGTSPWERFTTSGASPLPRHGHSAIYDATADRMVLFGGYYGERGNDTWAFPLSGAPAWSRIVPTTPTPPERTQHAAACDAAKGRLVIFGGSGSYASLNDTWVLPLQGSPAWSMIQPVDAPAPIGPAPVFTDSIGGIPATIFLGQSFTINTAVRNDGVASDDGRIVIAFPTLTDPADGARVSSVTAGDAPGFRVRAAGSTIEGAACQPLAATYLVTEYADDAWSEFGGETQRFDLRVTPRTTGTFVVEVRSTMRSVGGYACDPVNGLPSNGAVGPVDQQGWAVKRFAVTVQPLPPPGTAPVRRRLHTAIHDPVRNRMLVFGGWVGAPNAETWALSLDGAPAWSPVLTDAGPTPRYGHAAIYDPLRDRMIVFGGFDDARRNDVWALSLSGDPTWTRIVSQGTLAPPARRFHSAVYDPVRDRMVIFGGSSNSGDTNDIWALDLADPRWTHFSYPYPRPLWRKYHGAAYDPVRDRMIVFGGLAGTGTYYDDIWAFSFTGTPRWDQIGPVGGPWPEPRTGHTLTYEPARDRLWMLGGNTGTFENDAWTYSLTHGTWEQIGAWGTPMSVRELHTTIADPGADRLVVYGGTDSLGRLGDTWFLSRSEPPTWRKLGASPPPPPPPDPVPAFAAQVALLPASIVIGQTFQVMVSVRNDGYPSDDGRISLGLPGLTDPGDGQWVSTAPAGGHPGLVRSPAGTTLPDASCQPVIAPYLVADYADSSWQGFGVETHTVTFNVQPRAVGPFYVDVRATMHRAGAGCAVENAVPDGGEGSYVDPQGFPVKRFLVTVLPPSGAAGPVFTGWGVYPGRITLGQTFTVSVSARNDGVSSDDGRIVVGFPALTAAGDGVNVSDDTGPDLPGYRKLPAGTVLADSTCNAVVASYLTAEYADNDWRPSGTEQNAMQLTVRPREAGTFYVYVRSTLRTAGLGPCTYVNGAPPSGFGGRVTDQQGWTVARYAVTVDPPPTEARPSIRSVEISSTFLIVSQSLRLHIDASNLGLASDDGRIVVGFPSLIDSSDVDRVHLQELYGEGQYRERPAGSAIADSLCAPMTAGYLSVEFVDTDWQWLDLETHHLAVSVTPRVTGTFYIDIRTTMRTGGAGPCAYVNAVPESGDSLIVDPQGWLVRRFAITVLEVPPPDPAFVGLIGPARSSIDLGQTFALYSIVRNVGWTSDDGRICISFPSLTAPSDGALVADPGTYGYQEHVAGDTIMRSDCRPMAASHLMVELVDPQWQGIGSGEEQHELQLQVTPRDTGDFVIRMRSTMRVTTAPPCVYANESMGSSDTDQQGWAVRTFTVRVNPPPPTAPVFLDLSGVPTAISLGETFTISGVVRNDGGGSGDGRISFGFPSLTGPGDAQWVLGTGASDLPGLVERPAGSTLNTATCQSVQAGYLVAEYVDGDWKQTEMNTVSLQVQPQAQGTFYVDVRATMRDTTLSGGPCGYPNALPPNGVAGTDPQGWAIKRFAVQVGPPLGPPTVSWWPLTTGPSGPTARSGATAVYDTRRQSMLLYGGADPSYRVDVWSLPLAIDGAAWSPIVPGGPVPLRRLMHSMIYNPRDDQLVIFAGIYDDYINDIVVLALGATPWWFLNPGYGAPPDPRGGHTALYDSLRQRMLVIGGYGGGALHNDVWEYAPPGAGTWREIAVAGTPMPPRAQHAAVYDPVRDRVLVVGGDGGTFRNDVWALNLTDPPRWEQITAGGVPPSGRREHTAIYDPVNDRVIVYGGFNGTRLGDVWALSLNGSPVWTRLTSMTVSPASRAGHAAVYDPMRHRMIVFGGNLQTGGLTSEVWALNLDPATPVTVALASSEATSERVRLVWAGEGLANVRATLYRAEGEEGDWLEMGSPSVEAGERLVYEDRAIVPGRRYGYRLVVREGAEETELPAVWVTVPERAVLRLIGASPNPAAGEVYVAFSLPDERAATLELFDLRGRRVATRAVGDLGAGPHRARLSEGQRLPAGVYMIRLTRGAEVLHAKAAIVR